MRKFLFFLLCFMIVRGSAQTRNEFWGKINITHPLNDRWSVGLDLHHRRQANYRTDDKNIFRYNLGNYGRILIYYKLPKNWTIVLSPIGYYGNEDILNAAGELRQTNELRISPGVMKSYDIGKIKNRNRFLYDIRFAEFDKATHFMQSRLHLQDNFTFPLHSFKENKSLNYFVSNEIFVKKHKTDIDFDQNRLYNALQWKFNRSDISMGYQWVLQKGTETIFHRNQLYISLNLTI